jgi:transcriptional regulator with XRE-family HTH domain
MKRGKSTAAAANGQQNVRSATQADKTIGARIRTRRLEQHISQSELGNMLGVSFQQVQKYEKGVNRIGSARLVQLAKALDIEVSFFLDERKRPPAERPVAEFMTTREGIQMAEAMLAIENSDVRQGLIDLARRLAAAGS